MLTKKAQKQIVLKEKRSQQLRSFLDGAVMYLFTLAGVMFSKYIPYYTQGSEIVFTFQWQRFVLSCGVALLVLGQDVVSGAKSGAAKLQKNNMRRRAIAAFCYGSMCYSVIGG